jgi:hypothetical protein
VVGKPAAAFFATALALLHADAAHTLMVGDDIETNVLAAQRQGLIGALVQNRQVPAPHAPQGQRQTRPSSAPSPTCQPCWRIVIAGVADMDDGLSRIQHCSGEVAQGKLPIPGMGWSAHIRDPEATRLGSSSRTRAPLPARDPLTGNRSRRADL